MYFFEPTVVRIIKRTISIVPKFKIELYSIKMIEIELMKKITLITVNINIFKMFSLNILSVG